MDWKQRPKPLFHDQPTDSALNLYPLRFNKTMISTWHCKDDLYHHVLSTIFLLMLVAFSLFVFVRMYMDDTNTSTQHDLALHLHLDSFSVIDFRVIEGQLIANWTAKFIFINNRRNDEIDIISIHPFDLLAYYQRTNLVSCASVAEPLVLKTEYQSVMEVEFSPHGCNEVVSMSAEVVRELEEDINKGKIGLKLKLDFETKHQGGDQASCDLDLEFNSIKLSAAQNCRIPLLPAMHA